MEVFDKESYFENGGNICPWCGSKNISANNDTEYDTTITWNTVSCEDCKNSWVDIYTLTDVTPINDEISTNTYPSRIR